ncbi:helix-turn-helix domain-containing protein [Microbacterium sp.]|uniref:helix-turn-helix domain-containing protein n=1 Tax=Microbacterium sp. TaxID=51671 RepID=UPI003C764FB7
MSVQLDLEELPISDSIEFLRERMRSAPVPLALEPLLGADIIARTRVADLGCVHMLSTQSQGADVVRTTRLSRDSTPPSLMVSVLDRGSGLVRRGDDVMALHPGDIALFTTDEPYRLRFSADALRHTFQVPFDRLELPRDIVTDQLSRPIHADHLTAATVSAFLLSAGRRASGAPVAEQSALEAPVLALVRLLLTRPVAGTSPGREAAARSLATRIQEHIAARLGDPDLSARSIAAAFSISERYVYSILSRRGIDLGDLVRVRRLDRAIQMLENPRMSSTKISVIAHQCGFADHAHFSRAFRARFGLTPSEWRARATDG